MGDDLGMQYVPPAADVIVGAGARAAPLDPAQRRSLYAGRILVTGGWLVLIPHAIGNGHHVANAEHALLDLALLLLGVSMITLSPVANRIPGAARAADAVLFYFFGPLN